MSNEVETSLVISKGRIFDSKRFLDFIPLRSIPLGMTTYLIGAALVFTTICIAQESPAPTEPPQITESPSPDVSQTPTASPSPTATPALAPSAPRNVRISFLPPPLEGKISLGIYDSTGELIRVLHKESRFDEFTVGADALVTKWDGKDDGGNDRPAGKYHARGFLVGALKVEDAGTTASPSPEPSPTETAQVKLMPNPLTKNAGANVDLTVAFDDKNVVLKTADGLPLHTAAQKANVSRAWIRKNGEKGLDIFVDEGGTISQIRVSNIDKMMAFDCGEFDLK